MNRHFLTDMALAAVGNFAQTVGVALTECDVDNITIDIIPRPHHPSELPTGRMAVYCFF
jgi:hypothetical protein